MALKNELPLNPVVNIIVNLATISAPRKAFDTAILIGDCTGVEDFDNARVVTYDSVDSILSAGFASSSRIAQAAQLIFGQQKTPKQVMIGKISTVTEGETTRTETPLEAFRACREVDGEWYIGIICADLTDTQILEIAQYTESCTPDSMFAFTTAEPEVCDAQDGGIFSQLQSRMYRRTIGQYSTSHPDAIAAIVGWAMGAMTGTANSAYTLAYKSEVGVQAENYVQTFTTNKVNALKSFNGNVYINRGTYYNIFEEGKVFDGSWFDEIIFLDKFKNDCQLALMDILVADPKVPQTEQGMGRLKNALQEECEVINKVGFIAGGVWKSRDMLDLKYGDTLPRGYLIQSEPIDGQTQADRDARKAPPIYVSLKLAGAIHHVTVQVDVNR